MPVSKWHFLSVTGKCPVDFRLLRGISPSLRCRRVQIKYWPSALS